ncbi:MAG: amylo-alpha-1,6-glucosidase [Nanoarchaeota archaeon]
MRVVHTLHGRSVEGTSEDPSFLFTSKRGGYLWLSAAGQPSRYAGGFFPVKTDTGFELRKAIERLDFDVPFTELHNRFSDAELVRDNASAQLIPHQDGLFVSSRNCSFTLVLDCRRFYENDDQGRIYSIEKDGETAVIHYTKYNDESRATAAYEIFVAVQGQIAEEISHWTEKRYPYDDQRHDHPASAYVFEALRLPPGEVAICYGADRHEVLRRAKQLYEHHDAILLQRQKLCSTRAPVIRVKDGETGMAYAACVQQLDSLHTSAFGHRGVFAGLPYFCQFWARDEAISLGAFMAEHRFEEAHELLLKNMRLIREDGRLANFSGKTNLASADALGWVCHRLLQYYHVHRKQLPFFETEEVKENLKKATAALCKSFEKDGLIENLPLETWMDTVAGDDVRAGSRVEIQALFAAQLRLIAFLLQELGSPEAHGWAEWERNFLHKVRQEFFSGHLKDGRDDATVRPNVFLAYYLAPALLTKEGWQASFDKCIERLWTGFGFATIDKQHTLFCQSYTGGDNRSYHRGDSWFWVNNLAAICMHRLDSRRYKAQIDAILQASQKEILFKSIVGHHAELSSARELRSEGCLSQAWSAAMFIELVHDLFGKNNPT